MDLSHMMKLIGLVLFLVGPELVSCQSSKLKWAPDEMFNPVTESQSCGLSTTDAAYVCDPNGILGDHLESFNWILKDAAYNSTKCPCSNYYCETSRGAKGYRIGLALVRQMTLQRNLDGQLNTPSDQAQLFAYHLENKGWNMGNCEEDIIIFYSEVDRVLALFGGSTATMKLTPYKRSLLSYRVGSRLEEGKIVEALNNLIFDLKIVLNCDDDEENADCGLHELRNGAPSRKTFMSGLAAFLLSLVLYHKVMF